MDEKSCFLLKHLTFHDNSSQIKNFIYKNCFFKVSFDSSGKEFCFSLMTRNESFDSKDFFCRQLFFAFSSLLSSELRSCRRRAKCEHKPVTWLHLHPLTCADADADADAEVAAAVGNRRSAAEDSRNIVSFQGLIRRCLLNGQD